MHPWLTGEIPLARLWHLPDGTSCVLLKDSRADNWQLRVVRDSATLRAEMFGSPLVAMTVAKEWRVAFDPAFEASH
jgi:hypothetical protein